MPDQPGLAQEQIDKIRKIVRVAVSNDALRPEVFSELSEQGFVALRRLERSPLPVGRDPEREARARVGVYLDTETSGLDFETEGVTQLALLRFRFDDQGIVSIDDTAWTRLNDPGVPIQPEVAAITGITDEMVKGRSIETSEITEVMKDAEIVVAHKAGFDRPFVEKAFPDAGFDRLPWFCSLEDIDWSARGFAGKNLEVLVLKLGYVYKAHDAQADVLAGATLLASKLGSGRAAINEMIENGNRSRIRIIATDSSFDAKDFLKARGYRWDGEKKDTGHRSWWTEIDADEATLAAELDFLRDRVFGVRSQKTLPAYRITPINRFSPRTRAVPDRLSLAPPLEVQPEPAPARNEPELELSP